MLSSIISWDSRWHCWVNEAETAKSGVFLVAVRGVVHCSCWTRGGSSGLPWLLSPSLQRHSQPLDNLTEDSFSSVLFSWLTVHQVCFLARDQSHRQYLPITFRLIRLPFYHQFYFYTGSYTNLSKIFFSTFNTLMKYTYLVLFLLIVLYLKILIWFKKQNKKQSVLKLYLLLSNVMRTIFN